MATFTAYFDESGTHEGSEAVAVAGYLSTPALWSEFKGEWQKALAEFGIDFFHMTDFAARRRQFQAWPEAKRRLCLSRLINVINSHVIASIGTVLPMTDYHIAFSKKANDYVGGPYGVATASCLMQLGKTFGLIGVHGWIAYVFEGGAQGRGQVITVFDQNMKDAGAKEWLRLASLTFEDKREACPLQAADILAYELYKHLPDFLGRGRPARYGIRALADAPRDWGYMEAPELKKWSHIVEIRADLDEGELAARPLAGRTGRPALLVSIDELKDRWRWWRCFNGQDTAPMEQRG